jgi:ribosome-binding protein aMBF1 (putative translation factor)
LGSIPQPKSVDLANESAQLRCEAAQNSVDFAPARGPVASGSDKVGAPDTRLDGQSAIIAIVSENIRRARKAAGLSQEELAFAADLDRTYISQVERQLRNMTIGVLARLAKALGTTPDKLLVPPRKAK